MLVWFSFLCTNNNEGNRRQKDLRSQRRCDDTCTSLCFLSITLPLSPTNTVRPVPSESALDVRGFGQEGPQPASLKSLLRTPPLAQPTLCGPRPRSVLLSGRSAQSLCQPSEWEAGRATGVRNPPLGGLKRGSSAPR